MTLYAFTSDHRTKAIHDPFLNFLPDSVYHRVKEAMGPEFHSPLEVRWLTYRTLSLGVREW
jgi:hypothetical protein